MMESEAGQIVVCELRGKCVGMQRYMFKWRRMQQWQKLRFHYQMRSVRQQARNNEPGTDSTVDIYVSLDFFQTNDIDLSWARLSFLPFLFLGAIKGRALVTNQL